jgi:hypothetical protein
MNTLYIKVKMAGGREIKTENWEAKRRFEIGKPTIEKTQFTI